MPWEHRLSNASKLWSKSWSFIRGNRHNTNMGEMQTYFDDTSLIIDGLAQE